MISVEERKALILKYGGVIFLTIGTLIALLAALTDGSIGSSWPPSISNVLAQFDTPQARIFSHSF